jgi:hypothetical protein
MLEERWIECEMMLVKILAERVPAEAEQKSGDEDEPETDEAVSKISLPGPAVLIERTKDAAADEKSAQYKEDHHRLMSRRGYRVREEESPVCDLVILGEEDVPAVV